MNDSGLVMVEVFEEHFCTRFFMWIARYDCGHWLRLTGQHVHIVQFKCCSSSNSSAFLQAVGGCRSDTTCW